MERKMRQREVPWNLHHDLPMTLKDGEKERHLALLNNHENRHI
jgi:hypothetical protein